ncbi:VWA domain-containing protein [Microlunatus capsulatus]|uniref:Ca-activated chloride channel family protein n=1 Tax=Microlunatus capsulatus TaxID=99117 RepID=A0ABS4Z4U8_9ACTN|nr:VWA domain-containing protein [Microlunatus capsulatus]MBP2416072.1 Ca-activated chloride channel family protein [Microlunatus capsulatus]
MSSGPGRRVLALCCALLVVLGSWLAPRPAAAAEAGKLVMVLDSSGSMKARVGGKSKISIAKAALASVVRGLPADAPVGLRVYGATVFDRSDKGACTDSQLVVPIGTANRDALQDEIRQYEPYGETPISYSLEQAAGDLGKDGKRTILLVSDGEETCDADPCETAAAITEAGVDVKVDVVGLAVSGKVRDQLRCVADKGNGTYYDADSADDLEESLDKLATRAFRPFRLTGTPVEGGRSPGTAPLVRPGQYLDTFDASDRPRYYRIARTAPGSTLRVGFTARPAGTVNTAVVRLRTPEGQECSAGLGQSIATGGTSPLVSGEVDSWVRREASDCNQADELVAQVATSGEDLAGGRFELLVAEEPPVTDADDLPERESAIRWQKMTATRAVKPPVPGSSLSDAPTLAPGTYRTTILTGESQVFAVPADWGQRVQVQVSIAPRTGALARALDVSDSLDLQLLGAGRGRYTNLAVRGLPERTFTLTDDDATYRVAASTPTVRYRNRLDFGPTDYAAVPGPQYVVLNMSEDRDDAFLVPYTLQVEVLGRAGAGAPTYAGASTPTPTPTPSPSPSPGASTPAAVPPPQEEDDDGVPTPVVLGIALGTLVLGAGGVLAALALGRRRRRS